MLGVAECEYCELHMSLEQHYPQQQEEFSIDRFFREYRAGLERFIASRTGVTGDPSDIASEVFCQFIEHCRRHEGQVIHHRPVLFKIARRRIADHFRGLRERAIPIEEAPELPAHGSLIADVEAKRELDVTLDALRNIHDAYREVIILHANVGLTINEIAEMTEKPAAHVRVLLFRARRALKRALKERGAPI